MRPAGETLRAGFILNNCVNFPMYRIDLGQGGPAWYDICGVAFRMLMVVSTPEGDGGLDLHLSARPAEIEAVRRAIAAQSAAPASSAALNGARPSGALSPA